MNKTIITVLAMCACTFALAQSTETRSLGPFSEVKAQEGIEVILKAGNKEEARIEASGLDLSEVLTEVSGGMLKIHLEGDNYRSIDVRVYVTFKQLSGLASSSGSSIVVESPVTSGDFEIDVSSAGRVRVAVDADEVEVEVSSSGSVDLTVKAAYLSADLSSSGELNVSGSVDRVDVETSSAAEFDGYDLVSKEASLQSSSGSSIKVAVTEKLDARASSGSSIRYKGDPARTNVESSSGGSIRKY